ncbi:MAG: hypothetical protein KJ718_03905 [Nanoarchaeota archaeon]|nr:hypothetical protein [Nanoarchaeota archaeon]MBU1051672.1 hypothetical protein [Nanoarchaeota archaeon]MBU1989085.1 hypothetical protein [Nanoarchaeota archaeon]
MRVRETNKKDIEEKFLEMSEYMSMDYLASCLKNHLDFDTRKFVLVKLSGLFEAKAMFLDAAKAMKSAAEINTNKQNKINDFTKSGELFIRGGDYDRADICMKKATSLAEGKQTEEVKGMIKEFYKTHARSCIERNKRKQAIAIYEKLVTFDLVEEEKKEFEKKLLELYEGVGDLDRYKKLQRRISN